MTPDISTATAKANLRIVEIPPHSLGFRAIFSIDRLATSLYRSDIGKGASLSLGRYRSTLRRYRPE
jgi:hypothetical protein